ncbi:N-methyl-L-tryptophan oxidase [Haladaptatus caseinilyticus]|uniref:N-methyl-L-tryptophan oxidase n=1 Tax=Haladaptatus caseinilyticus TaxID=2993314 RepID=UPI00224AA196|nr:N-methyl-L-tryptophan oxidase [Haladaptatus caseinilyticus]
MTHYDTIVVGVGGMGSATASHLANRGQDVLGLERYDVPHAQGSSHGVTRIIRKAYYEHPDYVPLLERAYDLWRELDDGHPTQLLHTTGCIVAGPEGSEKVAGARESCEKHDIDYELLSAAEINDRYSGYDLPEDFVAVVEPEGGFLHVEQCVVAHVQSALGNNAEIRAREAVLDWEPTPDDGVRVETDKASYTTDTMVVTAGAWAANLLPTLEPRAVPERQVLGWFQPESPERYQSHSFPVFTVECEEGYFYGFPEYGVPGYKVGKYNHFREQVNPDEMAEPDQADERVLRDFTERYFPDAAGTTMRLETCLFTNSPDGHFIIDTLPDHPQVVVGAGFSGHGFKLSSVVGEILAELAIEGESRHDIDLFSVNRF